MKVQIYAVYDTCSGLYEKPFFHTADDAVRREFQDVATTADHPINKHPEHYSIWRLGNFDNLTGDVKDEVNECLWNAIEAISQSQLVNLREADSPEDDDFHAELSQLSPGGTA